MKRRIALTVAMMATSVLHIGHADAAAGRCKGYESLLTTYAPKRGWDVNRMSRLMFRESRCTPTARSTTRDSGLLQINDVNLSYLTRKMGRTITPTALFDPVTNVQAAALLCSFWRASGASCYQAWVLQ